MAVQVIDVHERVKAKNDELAAEVRRRLEEHRVTAFNLVSSPGSGKTLLLERTLQRLGDHLEIAVIAGDLQSQKDAERLAPCTDKLIHAVVTGGTCHLDARQVLTALDAVDLSRTDLVFIENVGNLVCPANWDLGEEAKIIVYSVTEGEDQPLKYANMFRQAQYALLNKIDLLPHLSFDPARAMENAHQVNPTLRFFVTSALTGEGLDQWCTFIEAHVRDAVVA
ncbi:MAG: hydrogenase nickel incorporation protein HypB [Gemmatimonadales bacterium]|nr:hydrogenase nickel incorporation protein HypB [Gemmatimonadales bacterium]NIN48663.1 hydrogenase nickel incorporation protein HypB [Gemmatimonadales bacterium]NIP06127.1 hydrogenase nickel incorporation protein HypB [Gemmatimonadales bacterium]NIR01301.1 hydrogenase nickel incorporation protein HypB [Gemmatimonadales bacterium]